MEDQRPPPVQLLSPEEATGIQSMACYLFEMVYLYCQRVGTHVHSSVHTHTLQHGLRWMQSPHCGP